MMMKLVLLRLEETGVDEGRFYIFRVVVRACLALELKVRVVKPRKVVLYTGIVCFTTRISIQRAAHTIGCFRKASEPDGNQATASMLSSIG